MSDKGKKWFLIILLTPLCIVLYLSVKLRNDEDKKINNNHITVVGSLSYVGYKKIIVSYEIDGMNHSYTRSDPYSYLVAGEKFVTLVDKEDRDRALILFDSPIIDNIKTNYKSILPISLYRIMYNKSNIVFKYEVLGEEYKRIQELDEDENIEDYKVVYKIDNPKIAYLTPR
jgi:hypothetical protein